MNEQTYTEHLHALIAAWLALGDDADYAAWWNAVSAANTYLLEGVRS